MSANSKLTIAVHILTFLTLMHSRGWSTITSDQVAGSVHSNAVVIRRSLGELHRAGLVEVRRGPGAGWRLARAPHSITLLDVYRAIGAESLFGLHHGEPNQQCPVGRGIRPALETVYDGVEQAARDELARTTLSEMLARTLEPHGT
ncbi:Rrf2 family transcriptional regulator [Nocardia sp. NBC_01499]|uniref:Rrf2 family transcriptional regulator n=1 Tax=Nocardia sp. NBC_01499 TaxID=2903597 RepID=UPI00386C9913